jgi:hypothetical protein
VQAEVGKRIAAAVAGLSSSDAKKRDAATAEPERFKAKAYPALLKLEQAKDLEVRRRANQLLEKIRNAVPEEDLVRTSDVVHTADPKIAGGGSSRSR